MEAEGTPAIKVMTHSNNTSERDKYAAINQQYTNPNHSLYLNSTNAYMSMMVPSLLQHDRT